MRSLKRSLTARLLIYFLLLASMPLTVIGGVAYYSGRQQILKDVKSHLKSIAILKQQEVEKWVESDLKQTMTWLSLNPNRLSDIAILSTHLVGDPEYLAAHDSLFAEFKRIVTHQNLDPIFLIDSTNGRIVVSSDMSWEGQFRDNESYFIQGKTGAYISNIFHSLSLGQPTIVVSAPVKDNSGQLVGVLAAHADLKPLNEIMMKRSGLGMTGETYLVSRSNLLITNTVFEPHGAFRKWIFTQNVELALDGKTGIGQFIDYRGEPVIAAYTWIENIKLALIAEEDESEAFANITIFGRIILGLGVAISVLVVVIAVLFARTITHPIHQLVKGVKAVGRGDLDYKAGTLAKDEIGVLSGAFDKMTENLKKITVSRDELAVEIVERKAVEISLQESENNFRSLVESSLVGIFILQNGKIVYQNPEHKRLMGALGASFNIMRLDYIYPDDVEKVKEFYDNIQSGETETEDVDFRFYPPLKKSFGVDMRWVQCRANLIQYYGDNAMLFTVADITKIKELERLVLIRDKMTSLGHVAAGIAHEIRNPLTGINAYLYTLEDICDSDNWEPENFEMMRHIVGQVKIASNKIESVIKKVMDFSKPTVPKMDIIDINTCLERAIELSSVALRKVGIKIEKDLEQNLPKSYANANQIEQVILNLISNSVKAMEDTSGTKKIKIISSQEKSVIVIEVSDSGPGVLFDLRDKIWDPFFSTRDGTGIGLSIVHRIITDHGGFISVDTSELGGAKFKIELPMEKRRRSR